MDTLITKEPTYEFWLLEDVPAIFKRYISNQTSEEYRESARRGVEAYQQYADKYPALGYIVDVNNMGVIDPDDSAYSAENMIPKLKAMGLAGLVVIMPSDVVIEMSVDDYAERTAKHEFYHQSFGNLETAKIWLNNLLNMPVAKAS
jgi:aminopeptidase N